jgi:hypothetical protein
MNHSKVGNIVFGLVTFATLLIVAGSSLADVRSSSGNSAKSFQPVSTPLFTQPVTPTEDWTSPQQSEMPDLIDVDEESIPADSAGTNPEDGLKTAPAPSPNYSSCTYGETSKTCCDLVLLRCIANEWRPTLNSESVPPAAGEHLRKILEDPSWDGGGTIFERDFGYCIRSLKFEYCFEKETGLFVRFVWQLDANGNKQLSDRTVLEPDFIPSN